MSIPLTTVKNLINEYYKTDICVKSRKREYSEPRQIYMYLCNNLYVNKKKCYDYLTIAKSVNLKNHTSIIHSCRNVENWLLYDKRLQKDINYLENIIKDLQTFVY
jgi:chromosomal replication initiation ATPase DnaA